MRGKGPKFRRAGPRFWRAGEGQVRVRTRYPPRFSYGWACGLRVLGLVMRVEGQVRVRAKVLLGLVMLRSAR